MKKFKGTDVQKFKGADGPNPYVVLQIVEAARAFEEREKARQMQTSQKSKGAEVKA